MHRWSKKNNKTLQAEVKLLFPAMKHKIKYIHLIFYLKIYKISRRLENELENSGENLYLQLIRVHSQLIITCFRPTVIAYENCIAYVYIS